MKKTKINTFGLLLLLYSVTFLGCGEDDYIGPDEYCGNQTIKGAFVDKGIGRIYHHNSLDFYYIGNSDTTLWNGGYVPCTEISKAYIPNGEVGVLVRFSGSTRLAQDEFNPTDPLYVGINLTFIEKIEDEPK